MGVQEQWEDDSKSKVMRSAGNSCLQKLHLLSHGLSGASYCIWVPFAAGAEHVLHVGIYLCR